MRERTKPSDGTHDALNRMRRAYERGTGCHLTREMIDSLGLTILAQIWNEDDPRSSPTTEARGMKPTDRE